LDLCRLWDLVCRNKTQAEIAQIMGRDPAWVCRAIKEIHADFSTVFSTPNESRLVAENLANFQSLYAETLNTAFASSGYARTGALRLAADILRQKSAYEIAVGCVQSRKGRELDTPVCPRCDALDQLRAEFAPGDIETIFREVVEADRDRAASA
jgi:hypothetical protein